MLAAEERIPALASGEGASSLAAARRLLETHIEGKTETLSKTRGWGFREKILPDIGATWQLSENTRWGCEKSSWETVSGAALDANGSTLTDPSGKQYTWDFKNRLAQAVVPGTNGGTPAPLFRHKAEYNFGPSAASSTKSRILRDQRGTVL